MDINSYPSRLGAAVIFAPFLGALITSLATGLLLGGGRATGYIVYFGMIYAYPATLLIGLPFHLALARFGRDNWLWYITGGFVIGTCTLSLLTGSGRIEDMGFSVMFGGLPGSLIATIARAIVGPVAQPRLRSGVNRSRLPAAS